MRVESACNLCVLVYVASVGSILGTLAGLPDLVASSFGAGGAAHAFLSRRAYTVFFVGLSALLPVVLAAAFTSLPRRFSQFVNVPNRELWLTPELRGLLFRRLALAGYFLAGTAALFLGAMHVLLIEATRTRRPASRRGRSSR